MAASLDLASVSPASLKAEVENGLNALVAAGTAAEALAPFLPGNLSAELSAGVKALTALEQVVEKL